MAKSEKKEMGMPDLTPMIDVVFQLLIFFMVTAVFAVTPGLDIKLPEAEEAQALPHVLRPDESRVIACLDAQCLEVRQSRWHLETVTTAEVQSQRLQGRVPVEHEQCVGRKRRCIHSVVAPIRVTPAGAKGEGQLLQ